MQSNIPQPAQTRGVESEDFQHSDWPLLQRAMALVLASGAPYTEWRRDRVTPLVASFRTPEGHLFPIVIMDRVIQKVTNVCRRLETFPSERDAELEWVYQLYANGQSSTRFPDFKRARGPVFERRLQAIKEYVRPS